MQIIVDLQKMKELKAKIGGEDVAYSELDTAGNADASASKPPELFKIAAWPQY